MTVEAAGSGGTLDSEIRDITVPDFTAPQVALSTPRVYRARTAREFQAWPAIPTRYLHPDVSSHDRAAVDSLRCVRSGDREAGRHCVLLNRAGNKMSDVQIAPSTAGATHQIDMGLASIPAGEYLVEITAKSGNGEAKELVPFRLGLVASTDLTPLTSRSTLQRMIRVGGTTCRAPEDGIVSTANHLARGWTRQSRRRGDRRVSYSAPRRPRHAR
jgi:hypothetical protein